MRSFGSFFVCSVLFTAFMVSSCTQIQSPKTEPFYAETSPPKVQEFRWSNGKMPKSFDPARAAAAPETDIVRSISEGLTEIDSQTLKEKPAVAEKWSSSEDLRVWTFQLRNDARWSNGKSVTANDFVSSWKRLLDLGDKTAHRDLFRNIVGMHDAKVGSEPHNGESVDFGHVPSETELHQSSTGLNSNSALKYQAQQTQNPSPTPSTLPSPVGHQPATPDKTAAKFGVEAIGETTLQITLEFPDKDLPKLVANPIFRPVYGDGSVFETDPLSKTLVTNGAFIIASAGKDGVVLTKSETYWNKGDVNLKHVRFVPKDTAEAALDAYKKGEIDAVTNADFEPLALKLLTPYEDFRQTTHSALNFYEINTKNVPFSDRRVREALAISIDRDRVTEGELDGSTRPATSFLPLGDKKISKISLDIDRAKQLLENAGYPNGENFPKIRLLVNRNDTQQRVARSVAKMWKQNLNLDTETIVKDAMELEVAKNSGEYDLVRRGIVLPTIDEVVSLEAIFGRGRISAMIPMSILPKENGKIDALTPTPLPVMLRSAESSPPDNHLSTEVDKSENTTTVTFTEQDAIYELNAIPLYFPTSYSLVKPYVNGFEINGLDAPLMKDISIDSEWQPNAAKRGL